MKAKSHRIVSWDSHLVLRAKEGEAVAFELISDAYRPALFSLAYRMLRNADDANDVVQEAFVKAFRAIRDFDPDRPIKPWLSRICSNCCVDSVRHRKHGTEPIDQHEHTLDDGTETVLERTNRVFCQGVVQEAVGRLPDRYRRIILMRHFRHMDVTEIASELGTPEGTIKSWLFRARALLKKDLGPALG